ncbi:MAG: acetyl-coenzyme A synthetase N-terminal domain-containing protein, partial [Reichenbachiella sp.]
MFNKIENLSEYFLAYEKSVANPEVFWERVANQFYWRKKWDKVVEYDFEKAHVEWFQNAKLNITENILERHLYTIGDKPAIIWEPNDPKEEGVTLTYHQLFEKVCQFSNVLKNNGIEKG